MWIHGRLVFATTDRAGLMSSQQSQTIVILVDAAVIGTPNPAWKPKITAFTPVLALGHHYKISGTQINGLSQANCYGDDAQMATNFPIAKFTNKGSGAVSYFRTFDFSTLAVASGAAIEDALVAIPGTAIPGDYTLQVIANGIPSDPVDVTLAAKIPAIVVNLQDDLLFGTICSESQFLTLQVFNVGGADLIVDSVARISGSADFDVMPDPVTPLTIEPGEEVDFTIRFEPSTKGVFESAVIRITSNDPVTPEFDIPTSGTLGTRHLAVAIADSGNFGNVCVGGFVDRLLTLNNNGHCTLSILGISSSSAEFEVPLVHNYPLHIEAGGSIELPIRFAPASFGGKNGVISIANDGPGSPSVVRVSGNAPAPRLVTMVPDSGSFGNVCRGSFADESLTLCNAGHCTLTIENIASSSAEFLPPSVLTFPFTIEPGNAIEVPIRFQPKALGLQSAIITVTSNDPAGPRTVTLTGEVPSGKIAITGSTYFGEVDCGIAQKTVSICNVGDCKLHVSSVRFSRKRRHFRLINNPFPATLHPGSCLGVVIEYKASCEPECCELVVESDDPVHPVRCLDVVAFTCCEKKCGCEKKSCGCGCEERDRDEEEEEER